MDLIDFILNCVLRVAEIALCICACIMLIRSLPKDSTVNVELNDDWDPDDEDIII